MQTMEGDVHMIVNNKYLVSVQGNGLAGRQDRLCAHPVDIATLSKM